MLLVCSDCSVEHTGWSVAMPYVHPLCWMRTLPVLIVIENWTVTSWLLHDKREREFRTKMQHQHDTMDMIRSLDPLLALNGHHGHIATLHGI